MAKPQPGFEAEASLLREMARSGARIWFRGHALKALADDDIYRVDVEDMLRACRVTLVEDSQGEETWRAEGVDFEGRKIVAVVVAYIEEYEIKVITGWLG